MLHNNGAEDCTIDMTDSKEEIAILSSSHGPLPEQNPLRKKKLQQEFWSLIFLTFTALEKTRVAFVHFGP